MDEKKIENTICNSEDTNVPVVTASLEMLTVNTKSPSSTETKRVLRKRISKVVPIEVSNRSSRSNHRPKKKIFKKSIKNLDENICSYYLDNSVKRIPNNLETIYEEDDNMSDNSKYMSTKRFKRLLMFKAEPTTSKLKKRRAKIQKVFGSKILYERKKHVSMQSILDRLDGLEENKSNENNTTIFDNLGLVG